jgi:hypothetical protein
MRQPLKINICTTISVTWFLQKAYSASWVQGGHASQGIISLGCKTELIPRLGCRADATLKGTAYRFWPVDLEDERRFGSVYYKPVVVGLYGDQVEVCKQV